MTGDARVGRRVAEATWRRVTWLRTASWATFILVVATALSAVFVAASASASAVTSTYGYDTAAYVYDAPALFSSPDTATSYLRGSPPGPEVASREGSPSTRGCCVAANTAGTASTVDGIPTVHWGQQAKHLPGHPEYIPGRSQLTANPEALVQRAGTGTPVGNVPRGQPGFRERIDFGETIGTWISRDGTSSSPTSVGVLHYRADGTVHIIPGRPQ